jgi:hypothetical protein
MAETNPLFLKVNLEQGGGSAACADCFFLSMAHDSACSPSIQSIA